MVYYVVGYYGRFMWFYFTEAEALEVVKYYREVLGWKRVYYYCEQHRTNIEHKPTITLKYFSYAKETLDKIATLWYNIYIIKKEKRFK